MEGGYDLISEAFRMILGAIIGGRAVVDPVTAEKDIDLFNASGSKPEFHVNVASIGVFR